MQRGCARLPGRMGWWRMVWVVCGLVGLGGLPGLAGAGTPPGLDLPLQTVDGQTLRLADWHGKVVLVNFWATWCPPCLEEIPALIRFQARYADTGVAVVGINSMDQVSQAQLAQFVAQYHINYPVVQGDPDRLESLAEGLGGLFGLPITKLLDRQGRLVGSHVGGLTEQELQEWVAPFLPTTAVEK